jgi:hypothetical protein
MQAVRYGFLGTSDVPIGIALGITAAHLDRSEGRAAAESMRRRARFGGQRSVPGVIV